jgi:hypothetical protein
MPRGVRIVPGPHVVRRQQQHECFRWRFGLDQRGRREIWLEQRFLRFHWGRPREPGPGRVRRRCRQQLSVVRRRVRKQHRLLQRRLPQSRLRLSGLRVGQSSVHVGRGLLQPELCGRQVRRLELNVFHDWQLVHVRRSMLFDALCEQRDVSGVLVLRASERFVLGQR